MDSHLILQGGNKRGRKPASGSVHHLLLHKISLIHLRHWNRLPSKMLTPPNLTEFKKHLDNTLRHTV